MSITLRIDATKVEPAGAYTTVTWSSNNTGVASIDANGKVTGHELGTAVIKAVSTKDETVFVEIIITVKEKEVIKPPVVPAEEVKVAGDSTVYEGMTIQLKATVLPAEASQNVTWSSNNNTYATVDAQGRVKGLVKGKTVYITATAENGVKSTRFTVKITEKPEVEPTPNLGGYKIVIYNAESALADDNPRLPAYKGADKAQKIRAWDEIENNYNVTFSVEAYPNDAPWGPSRVTYIINAANTNATKADFYVVSSDWVSQFANGNAILNTKEWYDRYGEGQMENALKESATYKGGLYAISTGSPARNYVDRGIFYNMALLEKYGFESPAKMFMEGRWTYSGFVEYAKAVKAKMNSNEFALAGHPYYYWMYMTNAAGIRVADINTMRLNLTVPAAKAAAAALREIIQAGAYDTTIAYDANVVSFNEGRTLMQVGDLWFVKTDNRWKEDLWGDDTRFGYVPFPYPDTMTKEQTRIVSVGGSIYVQGNGKQYPAGVDAKSVYRAFTETFLRTARFLEEDPMYDELAIRTNNATSKIDDPYSVQAILFFTSNKVIFDPMNALGAPYTGGTLGPVLNSIVMNGDDYESSMLAGKTQTENLFISTFG